jgi:hypothetical protein
VTPEALTITVSGRVVGDPMPCWCPACLLQAALEVELELVGNGCIPMGHQRLRWCPDCGYEEQARVPSRP